MPSRSGRRTGGDHRGKGGAASWPRRARQTRSRQVAPGPDPPDVEREPTLGVTGRSARTSSWRAARDRKAARREARRATRTAFMEGAGYPTLAAPTESLWKWAHAPRNPRHPGRCDSLGTDRPAPSGAVADRRRVGSDRTARTHPWHAQAVVPRWGQRAIVLSAAPLQVERT